MVKGSSENWESKIYLFVKSFYKTKPLPQPRHESFERSWQRIFDSDWVSKDVSILAQKNLSKLFSGSWNTSKS